MTKDIKRYLLCSFLIFISAAELPLANADTTTYHIRSIRFHGLSRQRENMLKQATRTTRSVTQDTTAIMKIVTTILQRYQQEGDYFTTIDSMVIESDGETIQSDIDIYINERDEIKLDSLIIMSFDHDLSKKLNEMIDYRARDDIEFMFLNSIDRAMHYLENNGYPFAIIDIDSLVMTHNSLIKGFMSIDPGPRVTIDNISVTGNDITRDNVIIRESRLRLGSLYRHTEVAKVTNRIRKLGFFKKVSEPIFMNSKGQGELILSVEEGNMNNFDGVIGYNPGQTNEQGYFTGLADVTLANFLGTGRRIEAYWEKKTPKTQQLRLRYQEPWVMGYPVHLGVSFEQLIQDTTFIRRDWRFAIQVPITETIQFFADAGTESVSPDSLGSVLWQLPKSTSRFATVGIAIDTRNDLINPSHGIYYETDVEVARKKIDASGYVNDAIGRGSFTRRKMSMDVELYISTFKWQVLSLGFHGKQVKSDEKAISISDVYRFGGSNTLRGFREDEFIGERVAWLNTEYRYLLSERSRAFLFFDSGYYEREDDKNMKREAWKFGYGVGLRIDTRLGIIGLDYGLARGRSFANGLIHVRLINEF